MRITYQLFRLAVVTICLSIISGCELTNVSMPNWFDTNEEPVEASMSDTQMVQRAKMQESGIRYPQTKPVMENGEIREHKNAIWLTPKTLYKPGFTHKSLSDYAEQLAMQLVASSRRLNPDSLVGVASFVELNKDLNTSNLVGNQLAEMFISEIQQFGVSVVDFKTSNVLNVLPEGDFVFSRNASNLADDLALDYVLSGTMIHSEKGVRVNARIISMHNKTVVSSASLMIPHFVIDQLSPDYVVVGG